MAYMYKRPHHFHMLVSQAGKKLTLLVYIRCVVDDIVSFRTWPLQVIELPNDDNEKIFF